MRLQERLGRLVKSAIAELLKPAEDPRQSEGDPLTVAIRRHEALRRQARQSLAVVDAARRHLALPSQRLRKALSYLAAQARQALVAGQEDQARAVLRRRLAVRGELGRLEGQLAQMDEERENLAAAEERLAGQVERLRARREVLAVQADAADVQARIAAALAGASDEFASLRSQLEQAEQQTQQAQAQAAALDELMRSDLGAADVWDSMEHDLTDLAGLAAEQAVDQELQALRRQVTP